MKNNPVTMKPNEFTRNVRAKVLSHKNFNKIFCVGYNKTGTTTLERTLRLYGYSLPSQQEQEIRLTKNVFDTNYSEFRQFVEKFDAFQDMPFSQGLTFVAADALFPNSRFILSTRDSDAWFRSLTSFHKKIFGIDPENVTEKDVEKKFNYLYRGYGYSNKQRFLTKFEGDESVVDWSRLYDKRYYVEQYEQRNDLVKKYFRSAPEKLLVIDVTKESTTSRICRFLNIPEDLSIKMPHENKT